MNIVPLCFIFTDPTAAADNSEQYQRYAGDGEHRHRPPEHSRVRKVAQSRVSVLNVNYLVAEFVRVGVYLVPAVRIVLVIGEVPLLVRVIRLIRPVGGRVILVRNVYRVVRLARIGDKESRLVLRDRNAVSVYLALDKLPFGAVVQLFPVAAPSRSRSTVTLSGRSSS